MQGEKSVAGSKAAQPEPGQHLDRPADGQREGCNHEGQNPGTVAQEEQHIGKGGPAPRKERNLQIETKQFEHQDGDRKPGRYRQRKMARLGKGEQDAHAACPGEDRDPQAFPRKPDRLGMANPHKAPGHEEVQPQTCDRGQQTGRTGHQGKSADISQCHVACHEYGKQEARAEARHAKSGIDQADAHAADPEAPAFRAHQKLTNGSLRDCLRKLCASCSTAAG